MAGYPYPDSSNPDEFSNLLTVPGPQGGLGSIDPMAGRNRITKALLNISQPPPVSPWQQDTPAMPAMGGQAPAPSAPGTMAIGNMPSIAPNPMAMATGRPPMMAGLPTTQPSMPMPGRPNYG